MIFKNKIRMPVKTHKTSIYFMYNFAHFFSFYSAHTVWSIECGGNISPLFAVQKADEAWFARFESETYESATMEARELYDTMPLSHGEYALFAHDGYLRTETTREEAIFIYAFDSQVPVGMPYLLIVPYRSACNGEPISIGQMQLHIPKALPDVEKALFFSDFKTGAYSHTEGIKFWENHRDPSVKPVLIVER